MPVTLSSSFGNADFLPVCRFVAGSREFAGLDEIFDENRSVVVCFHPIVRQAAGGRGKDFGRKIFRRNPWQDEEAGVVDDKVQIALSLDGRPSDEFISGSGFPGGGAEPEQGQRLSFAVNVVSNLSTRQRRVSQVMITLDVFVPQSGLVF